MKIMKKQNFSNGKFDKNFERVVDFFGNAVDSVVAHQAQRDKQQAVQDCLHPRRHLLKSGIAQYDDGDKFLFSPDNPVNGSVAPYRSVGVAQLMSDGTFEFIQQPRLRAQSELIRKLAHGRVSKTKDGAIQLTLKVFQDEGINISEAIAEEAWIAKNAIVEWQMKR